MKKLLVLGCVVLFIAACSAPQENTDPQVPPAATEPTKDANAESAQPFKLTSPAFAQGEPIPVQYSCDGEDVSPALTWGNPPDGTQSFALIMDDPDAPGGTWVHWVLFNISPDTQELQEDLPITGKNQDPEAIFVGNNSWGRADYGGPCPPSGTHRYLFKLYALDTTIALLPGATKQELLNAMDGHILAETELMGTFSR